MPRPLAAADAQLEELLLRNASRRTDGPPGVGIGKVRPARGFTSADYRFLRTRTDGMSAHIAFVYRNAWGALRIGAGYAW